VLDVRYRGNKDVFVVVKRRDLNDDLA